MKRVQLFEFEDFQWFPDWLRTSLTNLIVVLIKMMGIQKVLASRISQVLKEKGFNDIVDLGSGAGGVMPLVLESLQNEENLADVKIILTDLYPSKTSIQTINNNGNEGISYKEESVDATNFTSAPDGLKTMINCFHHMSPKQARTILESAFRNKQPFLIYEMGENKMPIIIWWLMLPLSLVIMIIMVLFMTPFVRPLSFKQIVFTYMIPIIPIFYAWDGQASMPRMYSTEDMDELLEGLSSKEYSWVKEIAKTEKGKKLGTFVIGMPI